MSRSEVGLDNNNYLNCELCDRPFNRMSNLKRHWKRVHNNCEFPKYGKSRSVVVQCSSCNLSLNNFNKFKEHQEKVHDIIFKTEILEFKCVEDFKHWKTNVEEQDIVKFVKHRGVKTCPDKKIEYFQCNRSGFYESSVSCPEKRRREMKIKGSSKINAFCPARIKTEFFNDGKVNIEYCSTHIGHKLELAHVTLSDENRIEIASKIASKIPFDVILDDVQETVDPNLGLKRKHLLTKQDLRNVVREYSLESECIRHSDDAHSVEAWVEQEQASSQNSVIFYKPCGIDLPEYPQLKTEDFLLGIMTEAQAEMLKKYGDDCVCLDSTHGTNAYNFEMTTLLVLDDMRQGFPCSFFFSSRNDHIGIEIFLEAIKEKVGLIKCTTIMTDMADVFYNAWVNVMGETKHRLFCIWHVQRAWKKKINLIKNADKRKETSNKIYALLNELDENAFHHMFTVIINGLCQDPETNVFGYYFRSYYASNYKSWAYCYRKNTGINTNMHLERLHGILKHLYLRGKLAKRLDLTIYAVLRLLKRKLFDRLIVLEKGKLTSKIRNIRDRHKKSLQLKDVNVIQVSKDSWDVFSSTNFEIYSVTLTNISCKCSLVCGHCNACIHKFNCTCFDASIKWNMCKHIHLTCQSLKTSENISNNDNLNESTHLVIDEEQGDCNEKLAILKSVSHSDFQGRSENIELLKKSINDDLYELSSIVKHAETMEELEVIKKRVCVKALKPQLEAARLKSINYSMTEFPLKRKIDTRKKIDHQRQFKIKKNKKTKSESRTEEEEFQKIKINAIFDSKKALI